MKNNEVIRIAIAENSVIIRNGMTAVLKRVPNLKIQPMEVLSIDALQEFMRMHTPDILIVNPVFDGYFDLNRFRENPRTSHIKCVALQGSLLDTTLLNKYDEVISIFDDMDTITGKILRLQKHSGNEDVEEESESLSYREKEIVVCVVKGMTNKEIASKLCLSIHTVITHRRNIVRKLQIHSPAGLTIYAIVNKLVELDDVKK
ncbi:MAG: response regulator transcription factor [Tannerella sp.]|uniref:response regulator transcription factor n=1 Tax=Coprobacter fastidiosus TaxID=1099853 RepID=UPI0026203519|nr:response regulator transcription factor [Coprobacter fastidiosus]MBS6268004.1 response regulator transcription factor [Tannerella sp.]